MNKTLTTTAAFAALVLCSGFTEPPVPQVATCPYTKQVIGLHAPVDAQTGNSTAAAGPKIVTPSDEAASGPKSFRNLRLSELAWKPAGLFGKLLSWEVNSELQDKLTRWSSVVFVSPIRWIAGIARHAIGVAAAPVFALAPSPTAAETAVMSKSRTRQTNRRRQVIMDGRLPSLASSMGSSLDPAMGLDDIARSGHGGLQVGLRLERSLDSHYGDKPLELHVLVPGL